MDYKNKIAKVIKNHVYMDLETIEKLIEIPPKSEMGDYAFPCFQLAKNFKKSPNIIAEELKIKLNKEGFGNVESLGAYLNFFIDKGMFIKNILEQIISEGENYGCSKIGEGKTIYIEYSSPNIVKSFNFRHLFTTTVGNSLHKLFEKEGYRVEGINHLLDEKDVNNIFNVKFDSYEGETFYNDKMDIVVNELKEKGLLVKSNGAQVVNLNEYNMPPYIVLKDDETSIYTNIDLAVIKHRMKRYNFNKCIYIAPMSQVLHFKQVFKVLELGSYEGAKNCIHIGVGLVKFTDRKILAEKGEIISLDGLIRKAIDKTLESINEVNEALENKEDVAKKIGIGAIVFTYLKDSREKNIVFDWKDMISFEGETGPYIQYSYARANSILIKADKVNAEANFSKLTSKEEFELVKSLGSFRAKIHEAIEKLEPSIIVRYTIEVTKAFNDLYNVYSVLDLEDMGLMKARLLLVEATCQVIKNSLELIGIETVEKI